MSQSTVNLQKMKAVSAELEKIAASMAQNKRLLDDLMTTLKKIWKGEGAEAYQKAYVENSRNFQLLAESIRSCSQMLASTHGVYSKADMAAADAIKSKMAKG